MDDSKLTFSVILPCFNVEETLERTIESILKQDFNDYEIVAVNDGSFDKTLDILEFYKINSGIKVVNQKNKGLGAARNSGIKLAIGKYICLIDADDLWVSNKLSLVNKLIEEKNPEIISNDEIIYTKKSLFYLSNKPPKNLSNLLIGGNTLSPSAMIIKKNIFNEVGMFKEDKKFLGVEDLDYWIRIMNFEKKITHLPEPLGIYRRDIGNMSKSNEFNKRIINMYKLHANYFYSKGIISKADTINLETFLLLISLKNYPSKLNLKSFKNHFLRTGFKYILDFTFFKLFLRIISRKILGIVLTLTKYKRLKCIARKLL